MNLGPEVAVGRPISWTGGQTNGQSDIRPQTIEDRRAELERIVKGADAILFSEQIAAEGGLVFAKACEMGLEGIVLKRVDQ